MTDDQVQKKLDQLVTIANQLVDESKKRYGNQALLFYEAGGSFNIMKKDDSDDCLDSRQNDVVFTSTKYCTMDCGIW